MNGEQETKRGVLIVEDDDELRSLFSMMFEIENFRVFQASAGDLGLQTLDEHKASIDVMITDLGLPGIEGVDLIARAKATKPTIRIIGTSGLGAKNVREMVLRAGADEFFAKPFLPVDIVRLVKEYTQ
jgi:DNA-binding response OmpR family regulator